MSINLSTLDRYVQVAQQLSIVVTAFASDPHQVGTPYTSGLHSVHSMSALGPHQVSTRSTVKDDPVDTTIDLSYGGVLGT